MVDLASADVLQNAFLPRANMQAVNIETDAFVFYVQQLLRFPFHISLCLFPKLNNWKLFLVYGQEPTSLYNPKIIGFQLCETAERCIC